MTGFECTNCGYKISIPKDHRGKMGVCPKCKAQLDITEEVPQYSLTLMDVTQKFENQQQENGQAANNGTKIEQNFDNPEEKETDEHQTKRKLPWLIDIFLYPTNKAGLINLGAIILIPFLLGVLIKLLSRAIEQYPLLLIIQLPLVLFTFVIGIILSLYLIWYLCECIRDSAEGYVRAPSILGQFPGFGDVFWQYIRIIFCLLFFPGPAIIYYLNHEEPDATFWALVVYAVLSFPMSILALAVFDSTAGLNPIVIFKSIFRTFFPYCAIVSVFVLSIFLILERMPIIENSIISTLIQRILFTYLAIVAAHLLGWFYNRYEEELNWEV